MTRPGELQTFTFENSVDLMWKLYWEIARIQHASPHDIIDMKCFAFNAAVTAWQLTDWVFDDMTAKQKQSRGISTLSGLQQLVTSERRALHLCQWIATASKHRIVNNRHHDPTVTTAVRSAPVASGHFPDWELVIIDGNIERNAIDVFEEARMYWYRFLTVLGLIS
jgi:hypothetical protein